MNPSTATAAGPPARAGPRLARLAAALAAEERDPDDVIADEQGLRALCRATLQASHKAIHAPPCIFLSGFV